MTQIISQETYDSLSESARLHYVPIDGGQWLEDMLLIVSDVDDNGEEEEVEVRLSEVDSITYDAAIECFTILTNDGVEYYYWVDLFQDGQEDEETYDVLMQSVFAV